MPNWLNRTELLIGQNAIRKLQNSRVAIFGIGGVGGSAAEALIRGGIESVDLFDNDIFTETNLNRQLFATRKTLGQYKVEAAKERLLDINPNAQINAYKVFYTSENSSEFDFKKYDYIVDAIDTVKSKLEIIVNAKNVNVPVISAMGAGNKLNPEDFIVSDIAKTSICPLARVIRLELKKRKIKGVKVVFSKETPIKPVRAELARENSTKIAPGSISFAPPAMGLIIAGVVIKDLIEEL